MKSRKIMLQEIGALLCYRRGDWYIGGHEVSGMCRILGVSYGEGDYMLALKNADLEILKKVYAYFERGLKYMKDHPMKKCPCCGSIVDDLDEADSHKQMESKTAAQLHKEIERLAELCQGYEKSIKEHNDKVAKVLPVERPKEAPQGLRTLADWFDAVYEDAGTGEDVVQQDLRRWANDLLALQECLKEAVESNLGNKWVWPDTREKWFTKATALLKPINL